MKTQWEYDLVEKPFCEQLKTMGWEWLDGDTDVPELTEREDFREVLLKGRLATALRKLNLRDDQPCLDEARIAGANITAIEVKNGRKKERLAGMEAFARAFRVKRQLLVSSQGIPVDDFLSTPVETWLR
jgi:hypothetical protein